MDRTLVERRQTTSTEEREIIKNVFAVAPGVWRMKDIFVNVFIIHNINQTAWVLIDTGLKSSASKIKKMVAAVIEPGSAPSAILMTHGHFDHNGSLQELADEWQVPVYCHHMEMPYLTGRSSYPAPDPTVGGGLMASMSFVYPKGPLNFKGDLQELPEDGSVPFLPEWKWLHTPGHTPGHISLFRERDGVLVAGDACVTTKQESVFSVMTQKEEVCGPPKYFTPDWGAAARSVKLLAALEPNIISSGHGHAIYGDDARKGLHKLSRQFWQLGIPQKGRYVKEPALFTDEGPIYIPKARAGYLALKLIAASALVVVGIILYRNSKKK